MGGGRKGPYFRLLKLKKGNYSGLSHPSLISFFPGGYFLLNLQVHFWHIVSHARDHAMLGAIFGGCGSALVTSLDPYASPLESPSTHVGVMLAMGLAHLHRATEKLRGSQFSAQAGAARVDDAAPHSHSHAPRIMDGGDQRLTGDPDSRSDSNIPDRAHTPLPSASETPLL